MPRRPPDILALLRLLDEHGVRYVVTGSSAALLHGVELEPGDLDVTPALDRENLEPLAAVLRLIDARRDPEAGFGVWETGDGGEWRWVKRDPAPEDADWRLDPADPASFDHLFESAHGATDVVPEVGGTYEELRPRAVELDGVWVESVEDLLARITVPRRAKDGERDRALRSIQRQAMVSSTIGRASGGSSPSS